MLNVALRAFVLYALNTTARTGSHNSITSVLRQRRVAQEATQD
jgi:hypothetical protein